MPPSALVDPTPQQRALRARNAAYVRWAVAPDKSEGTARARAASRRSLDQRLIEQYSLDPTAPDLEERLVLLRKAYFGTLALKSAKSRRKARGK